MILLEQKWSDCVEKKHSDQQVSELHIEHYYSSRKQAAAVSQWELKWDKKQEQCSAEWEWQRLSYTKLRLFSQVSIYIDNRET